MKTYYNWDLPEVYYMEKERMCKTYTSCADCPFMKKFGKKCKDVNTKTAVDVVSQWSEEHPQRTYLSEFMKRVKWRDFDEETGLPHCCPSVLNLVNPYKFECECTCPDGKQGSLHCLKCWYQHFTDDDYECYKKFNDLDD